MLTKQARYSRRVESEDAEIGELTAVVNPLARAAGKDDPVFFAMWYFPDGLGQAALSVDHCGVLDTMASCLRDGGQYAQAIFRGFTKTTCAEVMTLWAMLYGHRSFVGWIGAEDGIASESVDTIARALEENDLLAGDFPEVCHAIRCLDGKHQRCRNQTFRGENTHVRLVTGQLVLPTIRLGQEEAKKLGIPVDERGYTLNSSARLDAFGILSFKRGRKHLRGDGRIQRIDAAVIDDFQTDLSASQPKDTERRVGVIRKSILRSGGHRESLACVCNGTIIVHGDGMQQILNRDLFPKFRSRKIPMLKKRATDEAEKLWFGDYSRFLKDWSNEDDASQSHAQKKALRFYEENRAAMDDGADATWHNAFAEDDNEISPIQHAYNILILEGEEVFGSECQQEPKLPDALAGDLTNRDILAKSSGAPRGDVPLWAHLLTAFIDCQERALYWGIGAWGDGFKGHIVDYGMFPDQVTGSLAYGGLKRSLAQEYPGRGPSGAFRAGLDSLMGSILGRVFRRSGDGVEFSVSRLLVDSGATTQIIYGAIREHERRQLIHPSKGRFIGPNGTQWADFKEHDGERLNHKGHWLLKPTGKSKDIRVAQFDANHWKSQLMDRLATGKDDPGCLTICGTARDNTQLAAQLLSEYRHRKPTATGKMVDIWKLRPGQSDNHLLDVCVGMMVAASIEGVALKELRTEPKPKKRYTSADIAKLRQREFVQKRGF